MCKWRTLHIMLVIPCPTSTAGITGRMSCSSVLSMLSLPMATSTLVTQGASSSPHLLIGATSLSLAHYIWGLEEHRLGQLERARLRQSRWVGVKWCPCSEGTFVNTKALYVISSTWLSVLWVHFLLLSVLMECEGVLDGCIRSSVH